VLRTPDTRLQTCWRAASSTLLACAEVLIRRGTRAARGGCADSSRGNEAALHRDRSRWAAGGARARWGCRRGLAAGTACAQRWHVSHGLGLQSRGSTIDCYHPPRICDWATRVVPTSNAHAAAHGGALRRTQPWCEARALRRWWPQSQTGCAPAIVSGWRMAARCHHHRSTETAALAVQARQPPRWLPPPSAQARSRCKLASHMTVL